MVNNFAVSLLSIHFNQSHDCSQSFKGMTGKERWVTETGNKEQGWEKEEGGEGERRTKWQGDPVCHQILEKKLGDERSPPCPSH